MCINILNHKIIFHSLGHWLCYGVICVFICFHSRFRCSFKQTDDQVGFCDTNIYSRKTKQHKKHKVKMLFYNNWKVEIFFYWTTMHSVPWFTRKGHKSNAVLLIPVKGGCGPGFCRITQCSQTFLSSSIPGSETANCFVIEKNSTSYFCFYKI